MSVMRSNMLRLYKDLLREASKFPIYNYRQNYTIFKKIVKIGGEASYTAMYALRRIRDAFRENHKLSDTEAVSSCYNKGIETLEVIKRQVIISSLYKTEKLVIE